MLAICVRCVITTAAGVVLCRSRSFPPFATHFSLDDTGGKNGGLRLNVRFARKNSPEMLRASHLTTTIFWPLSSCLATVLARRPRRCPLPSMTTCKAFKSAILISNCTILKTVVFWRIDRAVEMRNAPLIRRRTSCSHRVKEMSDGCRRLLSLESSRRTQRSRMDLRRRG
jgi:hypothetical protein